jgi:hypothetical protein
LRLLKEKWETGGRKDKSGSRKELMSAEIPGKSTEKKG